MTRIGSPYDLSNAPTVMIDTAVAAIGNAFVLANNLLGAKSKQAV